MAEYDYPPSKRSRNEDGWTKKVVNILRLVLSKL